MKESNRNKIISLIENKNIREENIERALYEAEVIPSSKDWYNFIEQLLLWFGGLALAFSLMFFVAYNWTEFGRFGKFALVEGLMVLTIGLYYYLGGEKLSAKVTLMVASILLGVLLALVGQTYQTGADPWQLFFYWALLMTPWAVVGRFSAIWLVWILLINTSLWLYMDTFRGVFGLSLYSESSMLWIFFIFNSLAWFVWEYASKKYNWLNDNWAVRLLGFVSMLSVTTLMLNLIWEDVSILALPLWIAWLVVIYWVYRVVSVDLFMLAMGMFSFSIVAVSSLIDVISWQHELLSILSIGVVIIGLGAGFASWLKNIQKEAEDAEQ